MLTTAPTTKLLRSKFVELLCVPQAMDRYVQLINPNLTVNEARAEVVAVERQTPRSATLTLRPNGAWQGFKAGQFVRVGLDIDGVRRTRTYSPASSQHASHDELEITVTVHPDGPVSNRLRDHVHPGTILHLGRAQGDFTLPEPRPDHLVLISGGSGITPLISMLRTLRDEGHQGQVHFRHYARTRAEFLYEPEVRALAPTQQTHYIATREGGSHIDPDTLAAFDGATAAVCGPPQLLEAVSNNWQGPLLTETFTPPSAQISGAAACGQLRFINSNLTTPIAAGTLLEQAEAAGLQPEFGCRMGICPTCTCRKSARPVKNIRTGEVSDEEDEDIQLCISVPAGDVALEI